MAIHIITEYTATVLKYPILYRRQVHCGSSEFNANDLLKHVVSLSTKNVLIICESRQCLEISVKELKLWRLVEVVISMIF